MKIRSSLWSRKKGRLRARVLHVLHHPLGATTGVVAAGVKDHIELGGPIVFRLLLRHVGGVRALAISGHAIGCKCLQTGVFDGVILELGHHALDIGLLTLVDPLKGVTFMYSILLNIHLGRALRTLRWR